MAAEFDQTGQLDVIFPRKETGTFAFFGCFVSGKVLGVNSVCLSVVEPC